MARAGPALFRSTPLRLAVGLVLLFALVSLASFGGSYLVIRNNLEASIRSDLAQEMAGFRAAPSAGALAQLVGAEASVTDPAAPHPDLCRAQRRGVRQCRADARAGRLYADRPGARRPPHRRQLPRPCRRLLRRPVDRRAEPPTDRRTRRHVPQRADPQPAADLRHRARRRHPAGAAFQGAGRGDHRDAGEADFGRSFRAGAERARPRRRPYPDRPPDRPDGGAPAGGDRGAATGLGRHRPRPQDPDPAGLGPAQPA